MVHCPSCGKEVKKPSREAKNYCLTFQDYNCKKCHHSFRVSVNESDYINSEAKFRLKLTF